MVSGEELKKWLIDNCMNEKGEIELSGLDLRDTIVRVEDLQCSFFFVKGVELNTSIRLCDFSASDIAIANITSDSLYVCDITYDDLELSDINKNPLNIVVRGGRR